MVTGYMCVCMLHSKGMCECYSGNKLCVCVTMVSGYVWVYNCGHRVCVGYHGNVCMGVSVVTGYVCVTVVIGYV